MKVSLYFQSNYPKEYEAVTGSVFSDELNETLDSAKIVLSNIESADRLTDLACHERCLINFSESLTSKYMLVDTYVENIINLEGDYIYEYTIGLMSYMKLFEKIQLPSRMLNLSLVTGQKTVNEVIHEMIDLYVPKCKTKYLTGSTYYYKQIVEYYDQDIFDIPCPNFQWNKPTLRTVITSLMNVAGCIPKIVGSKLKYINFNAPTTDFVYDPITMNYITRSNSSDSFVNTLSMQPEKVLDDNNYTLIENLGFRNDDSVYLKQAENLELQTRMPIYDIKNVDYVVPAKETITLKNASYEGYFKTSMKVKNTGTAVTVRLENNINGLITSDTIEFKNMTITSFHYGSNGEIVYDQIIETGSHYVLDEATRYFSYTLDSTPTYISVYCDTVDYITPTLEPNLRIALMDNQYLRFKLAEDSGITFDPTIYDEDSDWPRDYVIYRNYVKDVTDLFKEKKKRRLLETDFVSMPSSFDNTSDMAEYIYNTAQYTIGSNKIIGFSKEYTVSYGLWSENKTYIETITDALIEMDKDGDNFSVAEYFGGIPLMQYSTGGEYEPNVDIMTSRSIEFYSETSGGLFSYPLFTSAVFKIEYQPMNSFNIKYPKSNVDASYMIEQLDNQNSSIPQFDSMSSAERNKVDRVGNEVYSINQRTDSFSDLQPMNSLYDTDKITFKRKISLYEDFANVQYTLSKNYVLKNFYTSIATKYRAYEYSDYEGSVTRKENTIVYCYLNNYYFDSDDKVTFSDTYVAKHMIDGCVSHTTGNLLKYNILKEPDGEYYKNDLSIISDKNNLLLLYQEFNGNSFGIALRNGYDSTEGGVAQSWDIMDEDYWEEHSVYFTNDFDEERLSYVYTNESEMASVIDDLANYPKIDFDDTTATYIKIDTDFNKYVNEVINHTVQFHFYSDNERIEWTKHFLDLCSLKTEDNGTLKIVINSTDDMNDEEYESVISTIDMDIYVSTGVSNNSYICIDWVSLTNDYSLIDISNIKIVKDLGDDTYLDVIRFTKESNIIEYYYLSFNDTRSNIVHEDSPLLQPIGEIVHNSSDRSFTEYE